MVLKVEDYSYESFQQVALLYEEVADGYKFMCGKVATHIMLHPEKVPLLSRVGWESYAGAVIVTCSPRQV